MFWPLPNMYLRARTREEVPQDNATTEKSCQSSLTIPSMSGSIKSDQSKPFLEVMDQKSVFMDKKDIVTTDMIG